jgi:lipopolysaccharide transport system ATP-binding protein
MLPYLKPGNYTIGGAIADGVPGMHIQHHRRDEALHFKVHASHIIYGLFGVPIIECSIKKNSN